MYIKQWKTKMHSVIEANEHTMILSGFDSMILRYRQTYQLIDYILNKY